jgi:hypothetical protein
MAITLSGVVTGITLPQGLVWSDELTWTPVAMETTYSLTGALIFERTEKQSGRPITLIGGRNFTWITRSTLISLRELLEQDEDLTLTLHDARTFTVRPTAEPLAVSALPIVMDSGPANPSSGAWYVLEALKLIEV